MNFRPHHLRRSDAAIFFIMALLAGCGLIYEYLLSHYAGRVLGAIEATIYAVIGLMIVSMGVGSLLARRFERPFVAFVWLEVTIALLGASAVLLIAATFALSRLFPQMLADTFGLPPDLLPLGGALETASWLAKTTPFLMAVLLGTLIGMEIPLIARVRELLHARHLEHNTGSIYGVDYIGAGIGALLWVLWMLALPPALAASLTAACNLLAGLLFLLLFRHEIGRIRWLLAAHVGVAILVGTLAVYGSDWDATMENLLYRDRVIYRGDTRMQHIVVTERQIGGLSKPVYSLYINGRLQFSSSDEHIYHALLVYPALAASNRRDKILLIGGGDGLALRNIWRWQPKQVVMLDLDPELIRLFSAPVTTDGEVINTPLLELNRHAFADPRLTIRYGDAFLTVDVLLNSGEMFDAIIVDLPDPNHPDLNRLYSTRFYAKLHGLLAADGALVVQSTSPYHSKNTFLCVGKTVAASGFKVEQYHANVPSFGEWGWTIGVKSGAPASRRLARIEALPVNDNFVTKELLQAVFVFEKNYFAGLDRIAVNRLGSLAAYQYHQHDWQEAQGVPDPPKEE